ncbi:hypothetical protein EB796_017537 [Bugula neritina]|uniref:Uncharacterized protein n=1 Tax=Bugula neritina TaxID=10212 RepID=A0A7J7JCZ6_BUGNE|nr:hypothetical protein EB796_017537 [Bugula neritina]
MLRPQVPAALPLLQQRQSHQKEVYDKRAKDLKPLVGGDKVLVRAGDQQVWNEVTVLARSSQPQSYIVDSEGSKFRRNRTQLKSVLSSSDPVVDADIQEDQSQVTTAVATEGHVDVGKPTIPRTPEPTPRRSARATRGTLPSRYDQFDMN